MTNIERNLPASASQLGVGGLTSPQVPVSCAVIMCVYRGDSPPEFEKAIRSISDQALPQHVSVHFYLCVDGEVPAQIDEVIAKSQQALHRVVRNEVNVGLAVSLNRLIDHLGEEKYVARMDADDYSYGNRLATQIGFLESHPSIDVLGAAIEEFYDDRLMGVRRYPRTHAECLEYMVKASPFAHPTVCFRKAIFDNGVRYPVNHQNEDIALWFKLAEAGYAFANIAEPLLRFRVTDGTFRRRSKAKALGEFVIYKDGIFGLGRSPWNLAYPLLRLIFRLVFPGALIGLIYKTDLRRRLLNK